jgi:hypothetical protein
MSPTTGQGNHKCNYMISFQYFNDRNKCSLSAQTITVLNGSGVAMMVSSENKFCCYMLTTETVFSVHHFTFTSSINMVCNFITHFIYAKCYRCLYSYRSPGVVGVDLPGFYSLKDLESISELGTHIRHILLLPMGETSILDILNVLTFVEVKVLKSTQIWPETEIRTFWMRVHNLTLRPQGGEGENGMKSAEGNKMFSVPWLHIA